MREPALPPPLCSLAPALSLPGPSESGCSASYAAEHCTDTRGGARHCPSTDAYPPYTRGEAGLCILYRNKRADMAEESVSGADMAADSVNCADMAKESVNCTDITEDSVI